MKLRREVIQMSISIIALIAFVLIVVIGELFRVRNKRAFAKTTEKFRKDISLVIKELGPDINPEVSCINPRRFQTISKSDRR